MGEIVELDTSRNSSFTISVTAEDDGTWKMTIDEFYDCRMPASEMYREIAEALIPLAGGLVDTAEEIDPTQRGRLVACITMFESGVIDLHSQNFDTPERQRWFFDAVESLKSMMLKKWGLRLDKKPERDINHGGKKKQGEPV